MTPLTSARALYASYAQKLVAGGFFDSAASVNAYIAGDAYGADSHVPATPDEWVDAIVALSIATETAYVDGMERLDRSIGC